MSYTVITNLGDKTFILHKHVLAARADLTLPDDEIKGDWEILRPLNGAVISADVTTAGAITFPDWDDYPGGIPEQSARDVNPLATRVPRFFA